MGLSTAFSGRLAVAAFAAILAAVAGCSRRERGDAPLGPTYVEASACAGCHSKIAETYRRTGMGRSFYRPRPENTVENWDRRTTFHHRPSERYYAMIRRDGRYFQRRHQIGLDGKETNVVEKEIHFILGSGNHARSYLHRTPEGKLVQLPVAWYPAKGGYWAMNPGFDRPDHKDFRREITDDCVFCHASPMPEPTAAIDCQRCHGPGSEHLRVVQAGAPSDVIRRAIVNPARLNRDRRVEVCLQCHLETTSRTLPYSIRRYERGPFSYRPGEPLTDFILHFDHQAGAGHDDKFEIAHHGYRLRKSACFQKSGSMTCTTCHDPHYAPRGEEAVQRYIAACKSCHAQPHTAASCLPCHMPKRRTDDVVHVVMTDHYIQRRRPARDLLAPLREVHDTEETAYRGEVAAYYPSVAPELYLAVAQVTEGSNLAAGIPQLAAAIEKHRPQQAEFYYELAEAYWKTGARDRAIPTYEEVLRRQPNHVAALRNLAVALSAAGRLDEAAAILAKTPGDPASLSNLGEVYLKQGRLDDAAQTLRKALAINPDLPEAHNNLGETLSQKGDRAAAEQAFREAVRSQPDFAIAHNNLANLLVRTGDFRQAQYHFQQAIRSNPKYATARYNYGVALAVQQRFEEAQAELEAAVRLDPKLPEAHNNLGNVLAIRGERRRAAEHYRRAIELRPDFTEARSNLQSLESGR